MNAIKHPSRGPVSGISAEGSLSDYQYVVLIVRLLLDKQGYVKRGELLDGNAEVVSPFDGERGLMRALKRRLKEFEEDASAHGAAGSGMTHAEPE